MPISEFLRDAKCCVRCYQRITGNHIRRIFAFDSYEKKDTHPAENEETSAAINPIQTSPSPSSNEQSCPVCLGLLGNTFLRNCINKVTDKLLHENYDSDTFSINASIPNSLNIRQHSLYLAAKEQLRDETWRPEDIVSVKDSLKFGLIEKLEEKCGKKCDTKSNLRITIVADYANETQETSQLPKTNKEGKSRKRKNDGTVTKSIADIQKSLDELQNMEAMSRYATCPPTPPAEGCTVKEITCFHEAIFVAGRYNKYSRELSQTPWFIDGVRKTETSVQELVCEKILEFVRADDLKFISAGREDVDVKMLGSGRPFAVELMNPKRTKISEDEIKKLETSINESSKLIAVQRLKVVSKKDMALLKEGEEHKKKLYRATVYAKDGISDEKLASLKNIMDLVIAQKTPIRVLHRRPYAVRNKTIHTMSATRIDDKHFTLLLCTQAGTYIKEFVHGDFRRTSPSLGTLLDSEVDILDLDVEDVQLEWPPNQLRKTTPNET